MRTKLLLVVTVLALGLSAGGALAKGGPPSNDEKAQEKAEAHAAKDEAKDQKAEAKASDQAAKDAAEDQKEQAKAGIAATKDAAKDLKANAKTVAKTTKAQTKAQTKAAKEAAKELKFKNETRRLGYTCRGGTTHLEGRVVTITPGTATSPGSMTIMVTKGNKLGRSIVGTQVTISLLASTDVVRVGPSNLGALAAGATVRIDTRTCTPRDTNTTDGVTPVAGFVARKIFAH